MIKSIEYKGYFIEFNFYGQNEFSVQYIGDDFIFNSEKDAKKFIDERIKENVE